MLKKVATLKNLVCRALKKRYFLLQCSRGKYPRPFCHSSDVWDQFNESLLVPGNIGSKQLILQKIDLRTGKSRKNIFSVRGHAHSIVTCETTKKGWLIPENGNTIPEFMLDSLSPCHEICIDGNLTGGHAACSKDGRVLYYVERCTASAVAQSELVAYDTVARKVIRRYKDVGIFAHDVKISSDGNLAAIASYGAVLVFVHGELAENIFTAPKTSQQPCITLIDLKHDKILFQKIFKSDFALAHLDFGPQEKYVFVQGTRSKKMDTMTHQDVESIIRARGNPLSQEERRKRQIFLQGELIRIALNDFKVEHLKNITHCRSQSIVVSKKYKKIYMSFAVSQKLLVATVDPFKISKSIDCAAAGINDPRGLAITEEGNHLVVVDRWKNTVLFDIQKDEFIRAKTIATHNWVNSHITLCS